MTSFFKRFFKGRIRRINYFSSVLALMVFMYLINFGIITLAKSSSILILILSLLVTFLSFSLAFRRLHDFGRSGSLAAICFLPLISSYLIIINVIFVLILFFKKGDLSKNKFGGVDKEKDILKVLFPRS